MKKKVVILGSTGSIGTSTLGVIKKNIKKFDVILLTANNNYKKLISQAKEYKAKNVLIYNKTFYNYVKTALKNEKTKVFSNTTPINKIINTKIDYTMSAIVGLAGLQPTIDAIKVSKNVALANKETIICAWDILKKIKKKYKTKIIPVDSEHFSIMELTKNSKDSEISELIITASGGPFLNIPNEKLKYIKPHQAIKHPNWKMGKKISVDSATLMNKVFEVIEACKFFDFNYKKYKILVHLQSYVHSIIRFKNGLIKMILYNTDMKIPISNILLKDSISSFEQKNIKTKDLNNIKFYKVNVKKFPSIKLINKCLNLGPSVPIIINASNEVLVNLFLNRKIQFLDIVNTVNKIFKHKDFIKYARRRPKTVKEVMLVDKWARLNTLTMCVK